MADTYFTGKYGIEYNDWYTHCKATNFPFVTIRPRKKYADVCIDVIGQTYNLHPDAAWELSNLLQTYWAPSSGHSCGVFYTDKTRWRMNQNNGVVCLQAQVLKEHADMIATRMVELASDPRYQVPLRH